MKTISEIIQAIEEIYKLVPGSIVDKDRKKTVGEARKIAMYICRGYTRYSWEEIADAFHRDFSTIIFAYKTVKNDEYLSTKASIFAKKYIFMGDGMEINIALDMGVDLPKQGTSGSSGFDLAASGNYYMQSSSTVLVGTGVYVEIPEGFVGLVFERSSLHKSHLSLSNSVGVIDSDYRGEIKLAVRNNDEYDARTITHGQRLAQIVFMPAPVVRLVQKDTLTQTVRNNGGFGSTN